MTSTRDIERRAFLGTLARTGLVLVATSAGVRRLEAFELSPDASTVPDGACTRRSAL